MGSLSPLESAVGRDWPPVRWQNVTIVAAVSGGPDSVALLRALLQLREAGAAGQILVAHLDHALREGSQKDADFVAALAHELDCSFHSTRLESPLSSRGDGLEAAARDARYAFLKEVAASAGARYVVTGHTRDDQVETVLHRILRGTGLRGLAGIPRARTLIPGVSLFRPLLSVSREEVLAYLEQRNQKYCIDASNDESMFFRNRLRNELLPLLQAEYAPNVQNSLLRLSQLAGEADALLSDLVAAQMDTLQSRQGAAILIRRTAFAALPAFLARQTLMEIWREQGWPMRDMSLERWDALRRMIVDDTSPAHATFPGAIAVERGDEEVKFTPGR